MHLKILKFSVLLFNLCSLTCLCVSVSVYVSIYAYKMFVFVCVCVQVYLILRTEFYRFSSVLNVHHYNIIWKRKQILP